MDWLIIDKALADQCTAMNGSVPGFAVVPVLISNAAADALGFGILTGKYALPASILTAPDYEPWHALLTNVPVHTIDPGSLFTPAP